jgi:hypothetical protein
MSDLKRLTKYLDQVKSRLSDDVPPKHKHRPESYKRYLENEKSTTEAKIDQLKLEGKQ